MNPKNIKVCELCGKPSIALTDVIVEGALCHVCRPCSDFGEIVVSQEPALQIPKKEIKILEEPEEFELLVPDCAQRVQHAREKLDLRQEELALKIFERESVIHSIETGHIKPTLALAKKLENFLKINLIEKYKTESSKTLNFTDAKLTIGDLMKLKK